MTILLVLVAGWCLLSVPVAFAVASLIGAHHEHSRQPVALPVARSASRHHHAA